MKNFKIEAISKKPKKAWGSLCHTGQITINDYKEPFLMPLIEWDLEDYRKQWKEGLERIKTQDRSCLVATVKNLKTNPYIILWTLHKEDNKVYVRYQLLIDIVAKEVKFSIPLAEFSSKNCYQFVHPRKGETNEEGQKLSEWLIDL